MELIARFRLENLYKSKDYKNEETGETRAGKWKAQAMEEIEVADGTQRKLIDISLPEFVALGLKDRVGEIVEIPVRTYINGRRVGYYGVEAS